MGYFLGPLFLLFAKMCIDDDQKRPISAITLAKEKLGWMWILPVAYCPPWSDYLVWHKHLNCEGFAQNSLLCPSSNSLFLQKSTWNPLTCPSCPHSWPSLPCSRSSSLLCLHSYLPSREFAWKQEGLACQEELFWSILSQTRTCRHHIEHFIGLNLETVDLHLMQEAKGALYHRWNPFALRRDPFYPKSHQHNPCAQNTPPGDWEFVLHVQILHYR